jgi:hypothetical protein
MKTKLVFIFSLFLLIIVISVSLQNVSTNNFAKDPQSDFLTKTGVCPPFNLLDEEGNIINPVAGVNADKPYSPRQTCGKCHDYDKITQGFHF